MIYKRRVRNILKWHLVKWAASSGWLLSLYYPMRFSDEKTIGEDAFHLTVKYYESFSLNEHKF